MGAELRHVSFEISDVERARRYYDIFLGGLGFDRFVEDKDYLGYSNGDQSVWLIRDRSGRIRRHPPTGEEEVISEHVAFKVGSVEELERIQAELERRELYPFFRAEPHPEFSPGYTSATWVDPDQIVLEVFAIPKPKRRAAKKRPSRARAKPRGRKKRRSR
jgi:hypothetical protein